MMTKKNVAVEFIARKHKSYHLQMMVASKAGNDTLVGVKLVQMQVLETLLHESGIEFNPEYDRP
jgi:hypothetical protein